MASRNDANEERRAAIAAKLNGNEPDGLPTNLTEPEDQPHEAPVAVASHARRRPGTGDTPDRVSPTERIADLEAEVLRLQLAIVQTGGDMTGAHLTQAREHVQRVLDDVVDGKRKLTSELAEFLAAPLKA